MTRKSKLYKLEVIYPEGAWHTVCDTCGAPATDEDLFETSDHEWYAELDPSWEPPGWLADPEARANWVERFGDTRFFWPKADKLYFTKGTARKRADLLERYGAKVQIIESEPIVWLSPDVLMQRELDRLNGEITLLKSVLDGAHPERLDNGEDS